MWKKGSSRTYPLPDDWAIIKRAVKRRDKGVCQHILLSGRNAGKKCGAKGTDVNHIKEPWNHSLENLELLCSWHHNEITGGQGGNESARRKRVRNDKRKNHPGYQ